MAAIENRLRLETGFVEYALTDYSGRERKPIFYTVLFTPHERLTALHGDECGFIGDDFRPDQPYTTLNTRDGTFEHDGSHISGTIGGPTFGRTLAPQLFGLDAALATTDPTEFGNSLVVENRNYRFRENREGELVRITRESGGYRTSWWLDPQRDMSPVRIRTESEGRLYTEARISLERFGDVWFPREVAIHRGDAAGDDAPVQILSVISATFNQPEHPRTLAPIDAGFEPGMLISTFPTGSSGPQLLAWDGEKAIPHTEFIARVRAGELKRGPRNRAAIGTLPPAPPAAVEAAQRGLQPAETGSGALRARRYQWREYTEKFIARYALDEGQAQKARQVLRDCEERAEQYVASRQERLAAIEADIAAAKRSGSGSEWAAARGRLGEMVKPLDGIFEDVLKPRLDKIPTRQQREGIEAVQKARAAEARIRARETGLAVSTQR